MFSFVNVVASKSVHYCILFWLWNIKSDFQQTSFPFILPQQFFFMAQFISHPLLLQEGIVESLNMDNRNTISHSYLCLPEASCRSYVQQNTTS
jgi:hypothetical protein